MVTERARVVIGADGRNSHIAKSVHPEQYGDKPLSLPDCVSFEVIDRFALDGAFTFDRDFRDCGYRTWP